VNPFYREKIIFIGTKGKIVYLTEKNKIFFKSSSKYIDIENDFHKEQENVLKEVYNTILLETEAGKQLYVCMRDGKFEISTDGKNWTMTHTAPQYIDAVEEINKILNEECKQ
jgi:ABC-type oligopeptide transport system substrate-binding subunit